MIKLLDKSKILQFSQKHDGERYTERFNCWIHLIVMLNAVIMRFDSLREITASLLAETRKLAHLGITFKLERSTLADASKRRSEAIGDTDRKSTAVIRRGLKRKWSFSGLATMVRITLMYYVDFYSLFNNPEKEWESYCLKPRVRRLNHLFSIKGACKSEKNDSTALNQQSSHIFDQYLSFIGQQ